MVWTALRPSSSSTDTRQNSTSAPASLSIGLAWAAISSGVIGSQRGAAPAPPAVSRRRERANGGATRLPFRRAAFTAVPSRPTGLLRLPGWNASRCPRRARGLGLLAERAQRLQRTLQVGDER